MNRFVRWSARKRGQHTESQPDETPAEASYEAPVEIPVETESSAAPEHDGDDATDAGDGVTHALDEGLHDEGLPDPDTLGPDSDFTAFLAPGVSRDLRRRALRRLYSGSHYQQRDGLDDYDQDYRQLGVLSREVAERLRRWTRVIDQDRDEDEGPHAPLDETLDKDRDEDRDEDLHENLQESLGEGLNGSPTDTPNDAGEDVPQDRPAPAPHRQGSRDEAPPVTVSDDDSGDDGDDDDRNEANPSRGPNAPLR